MKYDSEASPDSGTWLSLDEGERISLVIEYHRHIREKLPNMSLHAALHVVVENQLAAGIPVVNETLNRLISEGLDRHDAIHALGSVLSKHIYDSLRGQAQSLDPNDAYFKDIRSLTARSWREGTR
jgi:hypothetical protein